MNIIIDERQLYLLENIIGNPQNVHFINEILTPLKKLKECKFTLDGKYVIYEGKAYNTTNGKEVLINEEWTLSDILHTGADVVSAGLDFVIPGSGAVVDVLNALSYVIEAQFKSDKEKVSLYLMAAITFAFVILPGPLQAIAVPLKRAVKTGAGFASKEVVKGLKIIGGILDTLLLEIPSKINAALKSPLAKNILGSYQGKISGFITNFTTRIKSLLSKLTGKTGKEGAEKVGKEGTEKAVKKGVNFYNGTIDSFKKSIKKEHPMSEDEAVKFLKNYNGDYHNDFIKLGFELPNQDIILTAAVLKNKIKMPAGKFLYHGTTSKNLENILKNGLDNSKGSTINPGGVMSDNLGKNITTATGDINYAKTFSEISANKTKGKEVILRFKNSNNQNLNFIGTHPSVNGKYLEYSLDGGKTWMKSSGKTAAKASLNKMSKLSLTNFFKSGSKISQGKLVLRKMGFATGKPYRYVVEKTGKATTATIKEITDDGVKVAFKNGNVIMVPIETFMKNAVGAPWGRRGYSVVVPFFIKRFSDMVLNGDIDYAKLAKLPDLNPDETSKESLAFLEEEVASYEGDTGKYNVNNKAKIVQQSLMKLGYPLPRFKDDGKFGPETLNALKKFQQDNGLISSMGKMNKLTARKLAELLKSKNIINSEELQNSLNSL